jgi:beta-glucanase (GH16 family)
MRTVAGSAVISSFFLYYDNSYKGSPEPWQEIDVEVMGKTTNSFQSNLITGTAENKTTSEQMHNGNNLSQSYHTYTIEWTPNYAVWLFDNTEIRRTTGSQVSALQKEMTYRFNLWISDVVSWAGQFNQSILPVYQYINWIKYSKYTPGAGTNGTDFTPEWQEDFDTFNSSKWAKGDWTFDGNMVDFSPNNIVVKDGYCVICLTKAGATGFTGEVPKDPTTSIIDQFPATGLKITPSGDINKKFYTVSLDGRLISFAHPFISSINPGLRITKTGNTALPEIRISGQ